MKLVIPNTTYFPALPTLPAFGAIDRFFRDSLEELTRWSQPANGSSALRSDLFEDGENYYLQADLPGMEKSELRLAVTSGVLELAVARRKNADAAADSNADMNAPESEAREDVRWAVTLPDGIDESAVAAKLEDGVLTVTLPKVAAPKPREITIA